MNAALVLRCLVLTNVLLDSLNSPLYIPAIQQDTSWVAFFNNNLDG